MNLFSWLNRMRRWSSNAFGRTIGTEGLPEGIEKEIAKLRDDPSSLSAWCNIAFIALEGAWRSEHTPHDICNELEAKLERRIAFTDPCYTGRNRHE